MAEFVEFRCEEWTEEVEQLKKIRLFDPKEIKSLVNKRREFEYKIERMTKAKDDFLRYIQFEVDLLRIITTRRKKTGIKISKGIIEHKLINRVIRLFKKVIFRFPDDIKLWMSLFKFCEEVNQKLVVSKMLVRMLQIHSSKVELWVYAAKWVISHDKSYDQARNFLVKGLRHHPTSDELYLELLKLELSNIKKCIKTKEKKIKNGKWNSDEVMESIISGKVVEIVYKAAVKAIKKADFKVCLLKAANGMTNIENMILQDMIKSHPSDEETWNAVAQRLYEGYDCNWQILKGENTLPKSIEDKSTEKEESNQKEKSETERIESSVEVYREAVKKLNTAKMWNYYLVHIIKMYYESLSNSISSNPELILLEEAMQGALSCGNLSEENFLKWAEIYQKAGKGCNNVESILTKGVEKYPKSLPLWHALLRFYLCNDDEQKGIEIFKRSLTNVPNESSLWELIIHYLKLKKSAKTEEIFKDGIIRGGKIAQVLKPWYLEWLVDNKGMEEARLAFNTNELQFPPCLELYKVMCELESSQSDKQPKLVRKCHELACSSFGQDNINVWLDFIRWELKNGDVTKVHEIHRRAINTLNPEKTNEFLTEYNFIKTDVS